ncbi:thioesterase [Nocardia nova]|uniref:Acyl-coenzyme A thioesterase THEM4 n=1 Tax=Nocardia nova TaxID=37330 RepID=A0A2S6A602_9NOCA|nr:PaaI family thioesterase [Nocardia nova]PPJ18760.1 thioesterase [Nocardia nova]PPJ27993.1 thioesterase [Nocardia nova]
MVSQLPDTAARTTSDYAELAETFRRLQAAVCAAAPPPDVTRRLVDKLGCTAAELERYRVPERQRPAHQRPTLEVTHPSLIPYVITEVGATRLEAVAQFTDAHLGGNGAVHGGQIPLLFDDLLGIFVGMKAQPGSRTAYLEVDYRRITPINRPLRVEAAIDRIEGRKTFISGRLLDGEHLCAVAEALFVRLLPGQP